MIKPCWTRQPDAVDPRVDRGRSTSIRACRRDRHDGRGSQTAVPNSARTPQNISGQPASLLGNRLSIGEAALSSSSFLRRKPLGFRRYRRGAGAVERGGLENRWGCKPLLGSNPSPAVLRAIVERARPHLAQACCRRPRHGLRRRVGSPASPPLATSLRRLGGGHGFLAQNRQADSFIHHDPGSDPANESTRVPHPLQSLEEPQDTRFFELSRGEWMIPDLGRKIPDLRLKARGNRADLFIVESSRIPPVSWRCHRDAANRS